MGEKSFDHSKKFWFNKLRRAYPLAEVVKIAVAEVMVPQAEALKAASSEPKPTFKPRFKANIIASNTEVKNNQVEETETPNSEPSKPKNTAKPAYKPRFKAPAKPADELYVEESGISPQKEIVDPKPAYRPRFKAGVVKRDEEGG